jgi:alpha-tubulin suppressor-like RCC1 family protein
VQGLSNITAISAGSDHTLALASDGTVWAWGMNFFGALGDGTDGRNPDGTTSIRNTPAQVQGLNNITAILAGRNYNIALASDGEAFHLDNKPFYFIGV